MFLFGNLVKPKPVRKGVTREDSFWKPFLLACFNLTKYDNLLFMKNRWYFIQRDHRGPGEPRKRRGYGVCLPKSLAVINFPINEIWLKRKKSELGAAGQSEGEPRCSCPIMWESLSSRRLQSEILIALPPPSMCKPAPRRDTTSQYFMSQSWPRHGPRNWAAFPFYATCISRPFNGPGVWGWHGVGWGVCVDGGDLEKWAKHNP